MKNVFLGTIFLFATAANAATVVYSSPGVVTGIGGLDIGGTLYNVDFDLPGYPTFGGVEEFWATALEAMVATDAVVGVLNGVGAVAVRNCSEIETASCAPFNAFTVWAGVEIPSLGVSSYANPDAWSVLSGSVGGTVTAWSVVPIPAAVYLFASGLGLLGWVRKRA